MPGSRKFCFTINDIPQDMAHTPELPFNADYVKFAIWQLEEGDNHHRHVQGFLTTTASLSFGTVKKWFEPFKPHVEAAHGSYDDNIKYCSKTATQISGPKEFGTRPAVGTGQGSRTDLQSVVAPLKNGKRLNEIVEDAKCAEVFVKYHRGLTALEMIWNKPKPREDITVTVCFGEPGTGKTRMAMDSPSVFKKPVGDKWFDGYDGEKRLVLDEFNAYLSWSVLLQVLDVYALKVEVKGGFVNACWTEVWLTTNKHPKLWYDGTKHPFAALARRVTRWGVFTKTADMVDDSGRIVAESNYSNVFFNSYQEFENFVGAPVQKQQEHVE